MVTVPSETPLTNPLLETVAIAGSELIHGLLASGVPEPVSWVVPPEQMMRFPLIVGALTTFNE